MTHILSDRMKVLVAYTAADLSVRFPKYCTYNTVSDDATRWCEKNHEKVARLIHSKREVDATWGMGRHCERLIRRHKAHKIGYEVSDEAFYKIAMIEDLLPFMFDRSQWVFGAPEEMQPEKLSRTKQPSEGGNWVTTMVDLSAGYSKLSASDRFVLRCYFAPDEPEDVEWDVVNPALSRLLDALGGASPWTS